MAVALKEGTIFIRKKHELTDISKKLDTVTDEAIDLLAETMRDDKASRKERLECARDILDYKVSIADQINKDELNRQIAEIKAKGLSTPLVPADGTPKPSAPRLDMQTIQKV